MLALYAKAAVHRPLKDLESGQLQLPILPALTLNEIKVISPKHCAAYNNLTKWRPKMASLVHPNYIQTLSLPLQLRMMVNKAFPFSLMGLVHVANHIKVKTLPEQSACLYLRTYFGEVFFHPKGWLFEVITLGSASEINESTPSEVKATSYYLAKTRHTSDIMQSGAHKIPEWISVEKIEEQKQEQALNAKQYMGQTLSFSKDIGRKYAKISGDYNPIHLHSACAKLFGFKQVIAHGMYSKALVLSNIANEYCFYKNAFEVNTLFKRAITLPTQALLHTSFEENKSYHFQLTSNSPASNIDFLDGFIS